MIVDTSALIAILRDELEALACAHAIANSAVCRVSAANLVEAAVIIDASRDPIASRRFVDLIKEAQITIEPVTEPLELHGEAYRDFGKGSSHPAKLNFGDCFAYALAKFTGEPLLFKGDDFAPTDIKPAAETTRGVDSRCRSTQLPPNLPHSHPGGRISSINRLFAA
jgi:ribonuclease VapC